MSTEIIKANLFCFCQLDFVPLLRWLRVHSSITTAVSAQLCRLVQDGSYLAALQDYNNVVVCCCPCE